MNTLKDELQKWLQFNPKINNELTEKNPLETPDFLVVPKKIDTKQLIENEYYCKFYENIKSDRCEELKFSNYFPDSGNLNLFFDSLCQIIGRTLLIDNLPFEIFPINEYASTGKNNENWKRQVNIYNHFGCGDLFDHRIFYCKTKKNKKFSSKITGRFRLIVKVEKPNLIITFVDPYHMFRYYEYKRLEEFKIRSDCSKCVRDLIWYFG